MSIFSNTALIIFKFENNLNIVIFLFQLMSLFEILDCSLKYAHFDHVIDSTVENVNLWDWNVQFKLKKMLAITVQVLKP